MGRVRILLAEKVGFEPTDEIGKVLKYQRFSVFKSCMNKGYFLKMCNFLHFCTVEKVLEIGVYVGVNGGPGAV